MGVKTAPLLIHLVDLVIHRHKDRTLVEIEPSTEDSPSGRDALDTTQTLIRRIGLESDIDGIAAAGAKLVRAMLGYDRVMVYQFLHNGAGKVIAESRRASLGSFMGQHFPASDIPYQARRLYLANTIRSIGDVSYAPVPLEPPLQAGGKPRGHVVRPTAQRVAHPLRIPAEHGRLRLDVDLHRRRRRALGPDLLPPRQRQDRADAAADRRGAVRPVFLPSDRGGRAPGSDPRRQHRAGSPRQDRDRPEAGRRPSPRSRRSPARVQGADRLWRRRGLDRRCRQRDRIWFRQTRSCPTS